MEPAELTHPEANELGRFMRGELPRLEARVVVRHLLAGCRECLQVTRLFWKLGNPPLRLLAATPQATEPRPSRAEGALRKRTAS
jgi:hypothetical protein